MNAALILVDLQADFLGRAGMDPPVDALIQRCAELLDGWRALGLPVFHVHTRIRADGSDRMPHWARDDHWECVEGTPGVLAPGSLAPADGEIVVYKGYFSGFGDPALEAGLRKLAVNEVVVAGIYLHGCVRSTVLDAYERGFTIQVAEDAVGSTEPEHAAYSKAWLGRRAAEFRPSREILADLQARL